VLKAAVVSGFLVAAAVLPAGAAPQFTSTGQNPPAASPEGTAKNDYADGKSWLCRPGRPAGEDACAIDHTTTVVAADGTLTRETWAVDPNAPIDCFYVYPTVSTDRTPYSDMTADPAEINVVAQQAARFASKCRVYAPLYRQVTLAALTRGLGAGATPAPLDRGLGFDDVKEAWHYYLEHDNQGRGFVLIGHSQGSFVLAELMRQEIDGKPIQSRLVSAILSGTTIGVPPGKDVGGMFQKIPLCHKAADIGCVITFASFRSTVPPPANSLFGRPPAAGQVGACTNPAALGGGSGELHAYLSTAGRTITGTTPPKPWVEGKTVDTPWVSVPGLLTAECKTNENATYLEITVHGNPADPRTDDIIGDIGSAARPAANWGLHLVDMNLAMGNLLDIIGEQAGVYRKR
jgi:hypothetical protein